MYSQHLYACLQCLTVILRMPAMRFRAHINKHVYLVLYELTQKSFKRLVTISNCVCCFSHSDNGKVSSQPTNAILKTPYPRSITRTALIAYESTSYPQTFSALC